MNRLLLSRLEILDLRQSNAMPNLSCYCGVNEFTYYEIVCAWKSEAQLFQVRRLQSVIIFSILCHPCFFMAYYYLFGVLSSW